MFNGSKRGRDGAPPERSLGRRAVFHRVPLVQIERMRARCRKLARMRLLPFPYEISIGGIDNQAERLALEAEQAARSAEDLARALLWGDSSWRRGGARAEDREGESWQRSATGW